MGDKYGYAQVPAMEQNEDQQMIALKQEGIPDGHIFTDKQSDRDFHRADYEKMQLKLQILSFVAENERLNIRKRQEQGIAVLYYMKI